MIFFYHLMCEHETMPPASRPPLPAAKREQLFWRACIPVRLALGALASALAYAFAEARPFVGALGAAGALGFTSTAIAGGAGFFAHGFFGGPAWWHEMRFAHIATYATAGVLGFSRSPHAGWPLVADAAIAALAGWVHFAHR